MLNLTGIGNTTITFYDMFNHVHINKKWFYMSQELKKYHLLPKESEPLCTYKSKRFIKKVMFLTIVARSGFDTKGNVEFSRKIGNFPFVYKKLAKRNVRIELRECWKRN